MFDRVTGRADLADRGAAGSARATCRASRRGRRSRFPPSPPPFSRLKFTEGQINPYLEPEERARILELMREARNEGVFTPLSFTSEQISVPGELGGANWGAAAGDPETGLLYVRGADQPAYHARLTEQKLPDGRVRYSGRLGSMFFADNGLPAISPPWAQLTAYDLNTGTIKWQTPLGAVPALAAKGITGTGNNFRVHRNAPVVTAGGLIFIATFADRTVRAFDKDTGTVLWEKPMRANFAGIPAVYEVRGRQYVAFFGGSGEKPADGNIAWEAADPDTQGYYVFTLPDGPAAQGR